MDVKDAFSTTGGQWDTDLTLEWRLKQVFSKSTKSLLQADTSCFWQHPAIKLSKEG